MPATLFIISEQNIHQFITFNFESCCYPKIPQYQRLAHVHVYAAVVLGCVDDLITNITQLTIP